MEANIAHTLSFRSSVAWKAEQRISMGTEQPQERGYPREQ